MYRSSTVAVGAIAAIIGLAGPAAADPGNQPFSPADCHGYVIALYAQVEGLGTYSGPGTIPIPDFQRNVQAFCAQFSS